MKEVETNLLTNYAIATEVVASNFAKRKFGSRGLVLGISSLDYLSWASTGERLSLFRKCCIQQVFQFGAAINDHFDLNSINFTDYKLKRKAIRSNESELESFKIYRPRLSALEKNRPNPLILADTPSERLSQVINYREQVDRLSLAFCCSVAFNTPLQIFTDRPEEWQKKFPWFNSFFNCLMAGHVIDDIVGRFGDIENNRPSFYTAICRPDEIKKKEVRFDIKNKKELSQIIGNYLLEANGTAPKYMSPIITAVRAVVELYPFITEYLRAAIGGKGRFMGLQFMSKRDMSRA